MKQMLVMVILGSVLSAVIAVACRENYCDSVDCTRYAQDEDECREGQEFRPNGSICGCCGLCVTLLDEGDRCRAVPRGPILGGFITGEECRRPYTCKNGRCSR